MYYFGKFRYWCQKVLPLVYDDSLSYYEVLCKLIKYIEQMLGDLVNLGQDVTNLQALYVELKKTVDEYLSDERLAEVINARLDEMASDGTLDEIIGTATENFLANKTIEYAKDAGTFTAQRVFRVPFNWSTSALQSIAYDPLTRNFFLAGNHSDEDSSYMYVVNYGGVVSGSSPATLDYADVGHMNSMTYLNSKLYVAPASDPEGSIRIVELDAGDFSVIKTFNISEMLAEGGFIADADDLANVPAVSVYGDGLILFSAHVDGDYRRCLFFSLNPVTEEIVKKGQYYLKRPEAGSFHNQLFRQGMVVDGETTYTICHNPGSIVKYKLGDPEDLFTVVETGDGNGYYPYGELEDLVMVDGAVYLYTGVYMDDERAEHGFGNLWRTNLKGAGTSDIKTRPSCVDNETLYVDPTFSTVNPEGTSGNPFTSMEEASTVFNYVNKHCNPTFIQIYVKESPVGNDLLLLQDANCRVNTPDSKAIPKMVVNNAVVAIRYATITDLIAYNADLNISSCAITRLDASDSKIYMSHTTCNSYTLNRTLVHLMRPWGSWYEALVPNAVQSKIYGVPPINRVSDSHTMSTDGVVFVTSGFLQGYITNSSETNDTPFSVVWRDGAQGNHPETVFEFRLTTEDLGNLRNETTVEKYATQVVKNGQETAVVIMKAEVDLDQIAFFIDDVEWLTQGSGNPSGGLYDLRVAL